MYNGNNKNGLEMTDTVLNPGVKKEGIKHFSVYCLIINFLTLAVCGLSVFFMSTGAISVLGFRMNKNGVIQLIKSFLDNGYGASSVSFGRLFVLVFFAVYAALLLIAVIKTLFNLINFFASLRLRDKYRKVCLRFARGTLNTGTVFAMFAVAVIVGAATDISGVSAASMIMIAAVVAVTAADLVFIELYDERIDRFKVKDVRVFLTNLSQHIAVFTFSVFLVMTKISPVIADVDEKILGLSAKKGFNHFFTILFTVLSVMFFVVLILFVRSLFKNYVYSARCRKTHENPSKQYLKFGKMIRGYFIAMFIIEIIEFAVVCYLNVSRMKTLSFQNIWGIFAPSYLGTLIMLIGGIILSFAVDMTARFDANKERKKSKQVSFFDEDFPIGENETPYMDDEVPDTAALPFYKDDKEDTFEPGTLSFDDFMAAEENGIAADETSEESADQPEENTLDNETEDKKDV